MNPRNRPANPCVVEYLGQNSPDTERTTDPSGDGMEILDTHAGHAGMRPALQLLAGESAIPIQFPCGEVRWTRNREVGFKFGPMERAVKAQLQNLLSTLRGSLPT